MSQDKYAIFDKMIEGVQVITPDYTYLYVNETVTQQGKFTKEELLGYTMMEKYPGIETTEMFNHLVQCMETGKAHQMVNEFDFPDGSKGYFELRMQRVDDGVLIFSFDITEVKRAEELVKLTNVELEQRVKERTALHEISETRFQLAVAGTSAGIWDWKVADGTSEWWSPKFYELLGYENGEISPSLSSFNKIVHPDDYVHALEMLDAHLNNHEKFELEYRLKTKKGDYKWFLGNGQATWDENGKAVRMVGTIIDIDEKKRAENLLKESSRLLQLKNEELKEFVYVASHDLQEPVRTIASFINLFEENYKDKVDDEGKLMLEFMKGATERSQTLIVDLLDYSRLGANKTFEKVNLEKVLNEVKDDLASTIQDKKVIIKASPLPKVVGLKTELRLLFQNLISNAIKFSKHDKNPEISIIAESKDRYWQFSVTDKGIGFEQKQADKIFQVFKRLNSRKKYEGTGIGLAQCKRIVELHDGEIWAKSKPGKGSTFYFTLPNKKP